MASSFAALAGGIGGVVVLLVVIFLCFCTLRYRKYSNRNSDTASSDPSATVTMELRRGRTGTSFTPSRHFKMEELQKATKHFALSKWKSCRKPQSVLVRAISLVVGVLVWFS